MSERTPMVGRAPEQLTIAERFENAGRWMAMELYAPPGPKEQNGKVEIDFRLRRIRAVGDSVDDCIRQLKQAGADPANFEFTEIKRPY